MLLLQPDTTPQLPFHKYNSTPLYPTTNMLDTCNPHSTPQLPCHTYVSPHHTITPTIPYHNYHITNITNPTPPPLLPLTTTTIR